MSVAPDWATQFGLVRKGNYYEGYVDDLTVVLDTYKRNTISTWGTRRSSYTCDKENTPCEKVIQMIIVCFLTIFMQSKVPRLFWTLNNGHIVCFDNTPFRVVSKKTLECQFGHHYYKEKDQKSLRLHLQGTRKLGCPAHIRIFEYEVFTDYKVSFSDCSPLSKKSQIKQRNEQMNALKAAISHNEKVNFVRKWFVSLPTNDAHEKAHPTGITNGVAQKVNPMIANKIEELVKEGMTDPSEVQRSLRSFVKSGVSDDAPQPLDRAYYPTLVDIRNHIYRAKTALQLSRFDQQNLALLIKDWQTTQPHTSHYFRPYKSGNDKQQHGDVENDFLWVHQEQWQKDILLRYGNQISLMDATYRTTKYDLPLFFICVKTNYGYMVVAEFIVGSESVEAIVEPLKILQEWNPTWKPQYFMTDYSDAEIAALEEVFQNVVVYICDFHREQAWTRWARERKHGLSRCDGDLLLELLRDCAWAPSGEKDAVDYHYQQALKRLHSSLIWKNNLNVQQWLNSNWLRIPQVCICFDMYIDIFITFCCRGGHVLFEKKAIMLLVKLTMGQRLKINYSSTAISQRRRL